MDEINLHYNTLGGYGREELERSGAYRVYAEPAEMLTRLQEVGVRPIG